MRIVITVDGGLVQDVSCNTFLDAEVVVLDYDAEGVDCDEIYPIPQSDNPTDTQEATVQWHALGTTYGSIDRYLDEMSTQGARRAYEKG